MTKLMEQAICRLRAIPEAEQEAIAKFVLNEIEEDARWTASTERSESKLKNLINHVIADDARGECPPLDSDRL